MADSGLPPAINGTEQRLDAVIGELRALRDLMTPAAKPEPEDGTIELREPAETRRDLPPNLTAPLKGNIAVAPKRGRR
jgi:hypothetical protein